MRVRRGELINRMNTSIISIYNGRRISIRIRLIRITKFCNLVCNGNIETFHLSTCLKIVRNREGMSNVHGISDCLKRVIIKISTTISDKAFECTMNKNKAIDEKWAAHFALQSGSASAMMYLDKLSARMTT